MAAPALPGRSKKSQTSMALSDNSEPLLTPQEKRSTLKRHGTDNGSRDIFMQQISTSVTVGYSLATNGALRRAVTKGLGNQNAMDLYKMDGNECIAEEAYAEVVEAEEAGVFATGFNLTSAILGAGVLAMPYAFQMGGWGAIALLCAISALACLTSVIIAWSLDQSMEAVSEEDRGGEPVDWPLIGYAAFGDVGRRVVNTSFLLELYFILLSYLVVNGSNVQMLLPSMPLPALIGASGVASFALLFCPFWILTYFSLLGLIALGLTIALVLFTGLELVEQPDPAAYSLLRPAALPQLVGILLFAFVAHSALPSIYMPMKDKKKFAQVSGCAFAVSTLVYVVAGAAGYYFFAGDVQQNIIANIGRDLQLDVIPGLQFLPILASLSFATKLQLSFPLFSAPLLSASEAALHFSDSTPSLVKLLWRALFMAVTTLLAVLLRHHMADCLALTGCLFSMSTCFIFPASFYWKLNRGKLSVAKQIFLASLLVFGLYFMVTGTWTSLQRMLA